MRLSCIQEAGSQSGPGGGGRSHLQGVGGHVDHVRGSLGVVLLLLLLLAGSALLLVDGVALPLRQAEEAADHGQVLPQRAVLRGRLLLPAQQLAQPALRAREIDGERGGKRARGLLLPWCGECGQAMPCLKAGFITKRRHTQRLFMVTSAGITFLVFKDDLDYVFLRAFSEQEGNMKS